MSTFYTILHTVIMVRLLRVYVAETYLFCCYTGQVDILSVGSTKASELNANGACGSSSKDSEYELVRGRGASAKIELNFSNPLYAEPERVIACEIYESVSLFSTCRHVVDDLGTSYCTDKCFDHIFSFFFGLV